MLATLFWTALALAGPISSPNITLETGILTRTLSLEDGILRTTAIRPKGSTNLVRPDALVSEFTLKLMDGTTLSSPNYRVAQRQSSQDNKTLREILELVPLHSSHPRLRIEYAANQGDPFIRKRIEVSGSVPVDELAVESLPIEGPSELGGFGQPAFIAERWFAGLEHPGGTNTACAGRLECVHVTGRDRFTSPFAVIGYAHLPDEELGDAFERYLATLRRPAKPRLQFNTWFDARGCQVEPARMMATYQALERKLLVPHGLTLDDFVLDHGFENPSSLWLPSRSWPEGLAPFSRWLETKGSGLGLWLPLNGHKLDLAWGERQRYERSDHLKGSYCLAGPRYHAALREALSARIADGNLGYLKHDFNFLACQVPGHGHLPTDRHGRAANLEAQIELLQLERRLRPEIALNLTSGIWPSPWWLMHADFLWMGGSDYALDRSLPHEGTRQAETTFRDGTLYRVLRIDRAQVPPAALMTHGLIRGRHEASNPGETAREWSDHVVWFLGRGTLLQELYLSPDLMPEDFWPILGHALRWARANAAVLAHTRMIGGDPTRGAVYGYVHWSGDKGIYCLRNPGPREESFPLKVIGRPTSLPAVAQWHPIVVYPRREKLAPMTRSSADRTLPLAPRSVTIVELYATPPGVLADVPIGRFELDETDGLGTLTILTRPGTPEVRQSEPMRGDRKFRSGAFVTAAGPVAARAIQVLTEPDWGAWVSLRAAATPVAPIPARVPRSPTWDLATYPLPTDPNSSFTLAAFLPPSPLFPERARLTATLVEQTPLATEKSFPLSAATSVPDWPLAPDARVSVSQSVLLDDVVLTRRRSTAESLAWAALLGLAPIGLARWAAVGLLPALPRWAREGAFIATLAVLGVLYRVTPLGMALARALHE